MNKSLVFHSAILVFNVGIDLCFMGLAGYFWYENFDVSPLLQFVCFTLFMFWMRSFFASLDKFLDD